MTRTYRIVLDVYNSRASYWGCSVALYVDAYDARDAWQLIRYKSVSVSADGSKVSLTGGVGPDGYGYPEWDVVSCRISRAKNPANHVLPDGRYSVKPEWCGYPEPRWVVRFCDEFLSSFPNETSARRYAFRHGRTRTRKV